MTAPTELDERASEALKLFELECSVFDPAIPSHQRRVLAMGKVLSALPASEAGWRPLTCKDDRMTCPMPADETAVEVMLQDGTVCPAWYSCNILEAGDWDFLPVDAAGEPDDDADSIAAAVVAWRPAAPDRRA